MVSCITADVYFIYFVFEIILQGIINITKTVHMKVVGVIYEVAGFPSLVMNKWKGRKREQKNLQK